MTASTSLQRRGAPHRFPQADRQGRLIYGQQEVVKDLIAKRLADGGQILFEVADTSVHDFDRHGRTSVSATRARPQEIDCDFIGGCDGFHGICRPSFPAGVLTVYDRVYPFGWLGILAKSPPPDEELIYCLSRARLCAVLHALAELSRLYLQCAPDEDIENWPDERIWDELQARLGGVRAACSAARSCRRALPPMRSFVAEPMQYGRLFLAGDAAHIVPPTGAKGMNLALADVRVLSRAIEAHLQVRRASDLLKHYSRDLPAPGLEGAALLLVDDADAAPVSATTSISTPSGSSPSWTTSRARSRGDDFARRELRRPADRLTRRVASCLSMIPRVKPEGMLFRPCPPKRVREGGKSVPLRDHALIQRLDLDDRRAVVAADPERAGRRRIVDVDAADVGRARQLYSVYWPLLISSRDTRSVSIEPVQASPLLPATAS